jgi:hypothetical protein
MDTSNSLDLIHVRNFRTFGRWLHFRKDRCEWKYQMVDFIQVV